MKIRTNSHNLMDVRPSFGILRANSEDASIASLKIKYTGSLD